MPPKTKKPSLKLSPTPESIPIPSLPDDLLVSCFARVSKLYYPTLSLVSKSFQSLLTSPELHKTRSLLNHSERVLFVCFRFSPDPNPHWYTLCLKPNRNLKKKKQSSGYVLAPIPILNSPQALWPKPVVAIGSNIYAIGGPIDNEAYMPSSSVWVLDCESYTWREAPSMRLERRNATANVFDGKIYVVGGFSSNSMEVFDPKTQTWELLSPSPYEDGWERCFDKSAAFEGEIYFYGNEKESAVYKIKEDRWEAIKRYSELDLDWEWRKYCVIDKEGLYCYSKTDGIRWYDSNIRWWKNLKGLEKLTSKIPKYSCVKLVDYGGEMVVLWDKFLPNSGYEKKVICCAVIALEKRNNENINRREIWGRIKWLGDVLMVHGSYNFLCAVAVTV